MCDPYYRNCFCTDSSREAQRVKLHHVTANDSRSLTHLGNAITLYLNIFDGAENTIIHSMLFRKIGQYATAEVVLHLFC